MTQEIAHGSITFESMADLRFISELVADRLNVLKSAAEMMHDLGYGQNTPEQRDARTEARQCLVINLSLMDELRRLHPTQCSNPETCDIKNTDEFCDKVVKSLSDSIRRIDTIASQMLSVGYVEGPVLGTTPDGMDALLRDVKKSPKNGGNV
jgi:hypothetical protein